MAKNIRSLYRARTAGILLLLLCALLFSGLAGCQVKTAGQVDVGAGVYH